MKNSNISEKINENTSEKKISKSLTQILFKDLTDGKLYRVPYFLYSMFILIAPIFFAILLNLIIVGVMLNSDFSLSMATGNVIITTIFSLAITGLSLFINLNLTTKRLRDIGVESPWMWSFIVTLLPAILSSNVSTTIEVLIYGIPFAIMVFTPSNYADKFYIKKIK